MNKNCIYYDKERECCSVFSDWGNDPAVLQPCIESPCGYYHARQEENRLKEVSILETK